MNIDSLKYFVEVAESGSFYQASRKLFISQQGLNRSISALEGELDAQLFARSSRGVQLTEEGAVFYRGVQRVLQEYDTTLGRLFQIKRKRTLGDSPIRLSISFYAAQTASSDPDYVRLLANSSYIELPFDKLIDTARSSDGTDLVYLDVHGTSIEAIARDPDLVFEPIAATQCGIVSAAGSKVARRKSATCARVSDMPLAICSFREVRRLFDTLFAEHRPRDIRLETISPRMLIEYVQGAPDTVAFFDSFGFHLAQKDMTLSTDGLAFTPLDHPDAIAFMGFLQSRSTKPTLRAKYVKHVLRQWMNTHMGPYFVRYPTDRLWTEALGKRS